MKRVIVALCLTAIVACGFSSCEKYCTCTIMGISVTSETTMSKEDCKQIEKEANEGTPDNVKLVTCTWN